MEEKNISVLLVDDDPFAREVFVLVMEHHGMRVFPVEDAASALAFLEKNEADIIMIDLFLPESDGYQLLKEIRTASLARSAKLVATTAYYSHDTAQEAISRGFDGFVPKPFDAAGLAAYLSSVV
jgi:CheY-like chemotaxis protein